MSHFYLHKGFNDVKFSTWQNLSWLRPVWNRVGLLF